MCPLCGQGMFRAPDLQVPPAILNPEPARVLLDRAHALARLRHQLRVARQQQVAVGLRVAPCRPKLAQPKPVPGRSESCWRWEYRAFSMIVTHQDIPPPRSRTGHHLFRSSGDPSRPYPTTRRASGTSADNLRRHGVNRRHAIVQVMPHLAAAVQLALDGVANHPLIIVAYDRLHRKPILRRCLKVLGSRAPVWRQVQRPWNRRRTHVRTSTVVGAASTALVPDANFCSSSTTKPRSRNWTSGTACGGSQ